jgi:gamma-glutamylcyclotransferase (GGCT)/AIG2-like uncharacterized protein YtfP
MNKHLVFVYGTLRRDCTGAMSVRFPDSKFVADAEVRGSLYDLGSYPGLLLNESNLSVIGEVYEVDDETLDKLDEFEASSNYLRKQVEISLGDHRSMCWTYEPDREFYSLRTLITSGDWLEHAKTKTDQPGATWPDIRSIDVFFYGLFMDDTLLREKGMNPTNRRMAFVENFSLVIGARATLVPCSGRTAHGVLFSLTHAEVDALYAEDSVSVYRPEALLAHLGDGQIVPALCFNLPMPPSITERNPQYASKLRALAKRIGLPQSYVSSIQ